MLVLTHFLINAIVPGGAGQAVTSPSKAQNWEKSPAIEQRQPATLSSRLKVRIEGNTSKRILASFIEYPTIPYVQSVDASSFKRQLTVSDPSVKVGEFTATPVGAGSAIVYTAIIETNGLSMFTVTANQSAKATLYSTAVRRMQPDPEADAQVDKLLASFNTKKFAAWSTIPAFQTFLSQNGLQYAGQKDWDYLKDGFTWFSQNIRWQNYSGHTVKDITDSKRGDCLTAARYTAALWSNVGDCALLTGDYYKGSGHIIMLLRPRGGNWYPVNQVAEIDQFAISKALFTQVPRLMVIKSVEGPCIVRVQGSLIDTLCSSHGSSGISLIPLDGGNTAAKFDQNEFSAK